METLVNNTSAEAIEQQFNEKMNRNVNHQSFTFDPKIYLDTKIPDKQNSKQIRLRILPVSGTDPNVLNLVVVRCAKRQRNFLIRRKNIVVTAMTICLKCYINKHVPLNARQPI